MRATLRLLAVVGEERLPQFPGPRDGAGAGHRPRGAQVSRAGGPEGHAARGDRRVGCGDPEAARRSRIQEALHWRTACSPASFLMPSTSKFMDAFGAGNGSVSQGRRRHRVRTAGTSRSALRRSRSVAGYYWAATVIPTSQLADAIGPQGLPTTYAILLALLSRHPDRPIGGTAGPGIPSGRRRRAARPPRPHLVARRRHARRSASSTSSSRRGSATSSRLPALIVATTYYQGGAINRQVVDGGGRRRRRSSGCCSSC